MIRPLNESLSDLFGVPGVRRVFDAERIQMRVWPLFRRLASSLISAYGIRLSFERPLLCFISLGRGLAKTVLTAVLWSPAENKGAQIESEVGNTASLGVR